MEDSPSAERIARYIFQAMLKREPGLPLTAVEVFDELNRDLSERRIRLHLAEVKGPVQDRLMRTGFWQALSGEVYLSANDAFEALHGKA